MWPFKKSDKEYWFKLKCKCGNTKFTVVYLSRKSDEVGFMYQCDRCCKFVDIAIYETDCNGKKKQNTSTWWALFDRKMG